jgi:hypothetical protein
VLNPPHGTVDESFWCGSRSPPDSSPLSSHTTWIRRLSVGIRASRPQIERAAPIKVRAQAIGGASSRAFGRGAPLPHGQGRSVLPWRLQELRGSDKLHAGTIREGGCGSSGVASRQRLIEEHLHECWCVTSCCIRYFIVFHSCSIIFLDVASYK